MSEKVRIIGRPFMCIFLLVSAKNGAYWCFLGQRGRRNECLDQTAGEGEQLDTEAINGGSGV